MFGFTYGLVLSYKSYENNQITEFSEITTAKIISAHSGSESSPKITFEYDVHGSTYKKTVNVGKKYSSCWRNKKCIGEKVFIEFSTKNPNYSRLVK